MTLGTIQAATTTTLTWGDLGAMAAVFAFVAIVAAMVGATWFRKYFAPAEVSDRVTILEEGKAARSDMEEVARRLDIWMGSHPEGQRTLLESFQASLQTVITQVENAAEARHHSLRDDLNGVGRRLDKAFEDIGNNRQAAGEAVRRSEKAMDLANRNRVWLERNAQHMEDELEGIRELSESVVEIRSVMRIMYPEAAERVLGQHFTSGRTRTRRGGSKVPKQEGE